MRDNKGRFIKGNIPWTKYHSHKVESLSKMSNTWFKKGHPFGKRIKKGQHLSKNTEFKLIKGKPTCRDCGKKLSSYEAIYCRHHSMIGDRGPGWRGGISSINHIIRQSNLYKTWRRSVFERDNYTCQICFKRGNKLNADHIKPFALFPELRFELTNGRTLCEECHRKTPTWGINKINYDFIY